jgi:dTDP-4-amino-4,6-dideoxygalactose transaminase
VGSGTEALWMALLALGVGPGDEVITDEKTYTMDPQKLEDYLKIRNPKSAIQNRPKAVIPVHLFGQMSDMDPIMEIARAKGLFVIEDACQAHGAEYKGKHAGSIGDAGCFSFYPGKNLGAYGEAGAITTNNGKLAENMAMFRDHGQSKKYYHDMIGWNARMDGFQGAVLNVKLKHLPAWNEARRKSAKLYDDLLNNFDGLIAPHEAGYAKHVYHVYAIRVQNREKLMAGLVEKDIFCGIHYPVPVHLQHAYESSGIINSSCSVAERCAEEYISLPMFPELLDEQIDYAVNEIKRFLVGH